MEWLFLEASALQVTLDRRKSLVFSAAYLLSTIPASPGPARWHCQHPMRCCFPPLQHPTGWPRGHSSAGKHMAALPSGTSSPELFAFGGTEGRPGSDLLPCSLVTESRNELHARTSCRGISSEPGSGGSEQSRETGEVLLYFSHLDSSTNTEREAAPCNHVQGWIYSIRRSMGEVGQVALSRWLDSPSLSLLIIDGSETDRWENKR